MLHMEAFWRFDDVGPLSPTVLHGPLPSCKITMDSWKGLVKHGRLAREQADVQDPSTLNLLQPLLPSEWLNSLRSTRMY